MNEIVKFEPVVFERDGEVYANSKDVAAYFGKRHDNVLRDIDSLMAHPSILSDAYFQAVEDKHATVAGRVDRSFNMTKDGFAILVMGYHGAKAIAFKVAYIKRFNANVAELTRRREAEIIKNCTLAELNGILQPYEKQCFVTTIDIAASIGMHHNEVVSILLQVIKVNGPYAEKQFIFNYQNVKLAGPKNTPFPAYEMTLEGFCLLYPQLGDAKYYHLYKQIDELMGVDDQELLDVVVHSMKKAGGLPPKELAKILLVQPADE